MGLHTQVLSTYVGLDLRRFLNEQKPIFGNKRPKWPSKNTCYSAYYPKRILPVVLAICPTYLQISSSGHFLCTNNVADHEALLIKLELATAMGIRSIHVNVNKGDSQLVVRQVIAEYQAIEAKQ